MEGEKKNQKNPACLLAEQGNDTLLLGLLSEVPSPSVLWSLSAASENGSSRDNNNNNKRKKRKVQSERLDIKAPRTLATTRKDITAELMDHLFRFVSANM